MSVVGVAMVRDEADIVGPIVEHMLTQVDHVIVADNLSVDLTREILDKIAAVSDGRLTVVDDPDPAYEQSRKMTALAAMAHEMGADFVVPFDADEHWYSPFGRIADVLADVASQWLVIPATLYDHVATGRDPDVANPVERIGWRRAKPLPLPKVACRWRDDLVIEQGNHGARYIGGATVGEKLLVIRHFPYRSVAQFIGKVRNGAAAYAAMTDLPADMGTHWRQWGQILDADGEEALGDIFRKWYWRLEPEIPVSIDREQQAPLVFDPVSSL